MLILSRGRYDSITSDKILPNWVEIVVPESECEKYRANTSHDVVPIPDDVKTLGSTRNYVLRKFHEETVVMFDDDLIRLYCLTGRLSRPIEDPEEIVEVVANTAVMARDAGVSMFSFYQDDIRHYKGYEPFDLCTWGGGVIGVIGRKHRFAEGRSKVDVDFTLQCLLTDRIVFVNTMYRFAQKMNINAGGSSIFRTQKSVESDTDYLKRRWGKYVKFKEKKGTVGCMLNIERKRRVSL